MYSLQGAYPRKDKMKKKEKKIKKRKLRGPRHNPPGWKDKKYQHIPPV
jgi:hypothetical protein